MKVGSRKANTVPMESTQPEKGGVSLDSGAIPAITLDILEKMPYN
jgi:hypothetical protein